MGSDPIAGGSIGDGGQRQPQVTEQMTVMSREIDNLESCINNLLAGLDPVLRDPEPTPETQSKDERGLVVLADNLRMMSHRIRDCSRALAAATKRLEI